MANAAAQEAQGEQEMSMEDVLQSIRQIIAEEGAPTSDIPQSQQEEALAFGSDVLELTEVVEEPPAPADILQQIDAAAPMPPAPTAPPVVLPVAETPLAPLPVTTSGDRLISDAVAHASAASLKRVIDTHKASTPMPHFRSGTTLEDLVFESLKPMLKEWLDKQLPAMVERIVEREIRKLVD